MKRDTCRWFVGSGIVCSALVFGSGIAWSQNADRDFLVSQLADPVEPFILSASTGAGWNEASPTQLGTPFTLSLEQFNEMQISVGGFVENTQNQTTFRSAGVSGFYNYFAVKEGRSRFALGVSGAANVPFKDSGGVATPGYSSAADVTLDLLPVRFRVQGGGTWEQGSGQIQEQASLSAGILNPLHAGVFPMLNVNSDVLSNFETVITPGLTVRPYDELTFQVTVPVNTSNESYGAFVQVSYDLESFESQSSSALIAGL